MSSSVICSEAEVKINANKIVNYFDFLERQVDEFNKILAYLQERGLKDNLIDANITEISNYLSTSIQALSDELTKAVPETVKADVREIDAADTFRYPGSLLDTISHILSAFL